MEGIRTACDWSETVGPQEEDQGEKGLASNQTGIVEDFCYCQHENCRAIALRSSVRQRDSTFVINGLE